MYASPPPYVGRFAPSPTSALHFGSLLAALASYLDAHHHQGRWLLRMEDLDPPREQAGAATAILRTLEHFGLHWHGEVAYQSRRRADYDALLHQLLADRSAYRCDCSRQQIGARTEHGYDGHCRARQPQVQEPAAVRVAVKDAAFDLDDRIQGRRRWSLSAGQDDFVLFRRDGFFAYQLAVVADDAAQGITQVVRGSDLLDSTPRQYYLQRLLDLPHPSYAHIPVLVNAAGQKLSKQTFARAIHQEPPVPTLLRALGLLGQDPPPLLIEANRDELLRWAVVNWRLDKVPARLSLPASAIELGK